MSYSKFLLRVIEYIHIYVYNNIRGRTEINNDYELYKLKAELCKTFADPKRLMIISELRHGERTVGHLTQVLQVPQAVVSRHLAVLRSRGVVTTRREGVNVYYSLASRRIVDACDIVHEILLEQVAKNRDIAEKLIP